MRTPTERVFTERQQKLIELNIGYRYDASIKRGASFQSALRYSSAFNFDHYIDNLPSMANIERADADFKALFNAEYNTNDQQFVSDTIEAIINDINYATDYDNTKRIVDDTMADNEIDGKRDVGYDLLDKNTTYNTIHTLVNNLESIANNKELMTIIMKNLK